MVFVCSLQSKDTDGKLTVEQQCFSHQLCTYMKWRKLNQMQISMNSDIFIVCFHFKKSDSFTTQFKTQKSYIFPFVHVCVILNTCMHQRN